MLSARIHLLTFNKMLTRYLQWDRYYTRWTYRNGEQKKHGPSSLTELQQGSREGTRGWSTLIGLPFLSDLALFYRL